MTTNHLIIIFINRFPSDTIIGHDCRPISAFKEYVPAMKVAIVSVSTPIGPADRVVLRGALAVHFGPLWRGLSA